VSTSNLARPAAAATIFLAYALRHLPSFAGEARALLPGPCFASWPMLCASFTCLSRNYSWPMRCPICRLPVQERFLALVSADTLLVGHSVEADLNALRVVHHRVIDTALLYPHPRGPPLKCALRTLAAMHLGRRIPGRGERGTTAWRTRGPRWTSCTSRSRRVSGGRVRAWPVA